MRKHNGIGRYRKLMNRSQRDFGALIGVSVNTISKWEYEGAPSPHRLRQVVDMLIARRMILDYQTAREFWFNNGVTQFPEPPDLRRVFTPTAAPPPREPAPPITILRQMAYVPAGPFVRGSTPEQLEYVASLRARGGNNDPAECFENEMPQRLIHLDAFFIDVYEVTNEKFGLFCEESKYITTAEKQGWSNVWNDAPHVRAFERVEGANWRHPYGPGSSVEDRPFYPVVHMSWEDALECSLFYGKRLPSEAEWEKACRGPYGALFPHGDTCDFSTENCATLDADGSYHTNGLMERGSFPQGATMYGVQDMLGNASEWMADVFNPTFYVTSPSSDPYNTILPEHRTMQHARRGGSWATPPGLMHAAWRIDEPDTTNDVLGFRSARNVTESDEYVMAKKRREAADEHEQTSMN